MKRAIIVQLSAATALLGLMLVLLAGGGVPRRESPKPLMNLRPATEQERRDADREHLSEEMDRLWEQRQRQAAGR